MGSDQNFCVRSSYSITVNGASTGVDSQIAATQLTVQTSSAAADFLTRAPAVKGAWLQVRVVDPDHVLPQAVSKAPAPREPQFQLMLKGLTGYTRHARFVSGDGAGRNYQIAVPLKIALSLKVTSSVGNVFDPNGNQVQEKDAAAVQPSAPADLGLMTYTVRRK